MTKFNIGDRVNIVYTLYKGCVGVVTYISPGAKPVYTVDFFYSGKKCSMNFCDTHLSKR